MVQYGDKARLAVYLNDQQIGFVFTLQQLFNDGVVSSLNNSRRLRELREIGWIIDYDKQTRTYVLKRKGALPGEAGWNSGRQQISATVRRFILERDHYSCAVCGASVDDGATLTMGHIHPVALGGTNDEHNLRAECTTCNEPVRDMLFDIDDQHALLEEEFQEYQLPQSKEELIKLQQLISFRLAKL